MSSEAHDTGKEVDGTQADKINTGALGTLVAVGLLAMLSITAAVTALVRHDMEEEESQKDADSNQTVIALKDSQRGMLNGPAGYVDRGKGVVSLPIDLAKGLVVSELQRDPNSATPAPPPKADGGVVAEATDSGAAVDAAVTSTDAGKKLEAGSKGQAAKEKAVEPKPAPASSGKSAPAPAPASMPKPTPTAASPGAEAPGPVNH
jgi:hypothetical protein